MIAVIFEVWPKDGKAAAPNLQMVRHNCVTARAIRELVAR